jgi:hypothetical protein
VTTSAGKARLEAETDLVSQPAPTAGATPKTGTAASAATDGAPPPQPGGERGGPAGPEPTRYGDWEKGGRCFDF